MKIIVTADLHLNKLVYKGIMDRDCPLLPFRNVDFMKAFSYVCEKTIEEKPDLMVISGDVYDSHNPSNEIRGFFSSKLHEISSKNIPVIILVGNHDICRKHHALSSIRNLKLDNITVVDIPTVISFKGKNLLLLPYTLDVEQKNSTMKEEFCRFVKEVHDKNQEQNSLFFGHFGVAGAKLNEFEQEISSEDADGEVEIIKKAFLNKSKDDVSPNDLDSIGSEYVFLGDYHRFQMLPTKKCVAMYTGSLEKTDMSDKDSKKGFVIYDSDKVFDSGKNYQFVEYPNTRPMLEFKGNLQEIRTAVDKLDLQKLKGNPIVKLSFNGDKSELSDFNIKLDELKSQISKSIDPVHIYLAQKVTDKEQELKAVRIEQEMVENGNLEVSDVETVVAEMIKERETDLEEQQQILLLDKTIRDEVREKKMGMI